MNITAITILLKQDRDDIKLSSFLACFCVGLGCSWYHIGMRPADGADDEITSLDNYPDPLGDEHLASDPAWDDPRALENALHWRTGDVSRKCAMTRSSRAPTDVDDGTLGARSSVMHDRRQAGMLDGVSIRTRRECGATSIFTLAAKARLSPENAASIGETMRALHPHLLCPMQRLSDARVTKALSARECEVLYWSAMGKTSWAISKILNVSERTINFHIANSIDKLNAANRSHAVVKAVQIGAISV